MLCMLRQDNLPILTSVGQIKLALDPLCILNPDKVVLMEQGY